MVSKKLKAAQHRHPVLTVIGGLAGWAALGRQRGKKTGNQQQAMEQALMTGGAFAARFIVSHLMHRRKARKAAARAELAAPAPKRRRGRHR